MNLALASYLVCNLWAIGSSLNCDECLKYLELLSTVQLFLFVVTLAQQSSEGPAANRPRITPGFARGKGVVNVRFTSPLPAVKVTFTFT